MMKWLFSIFVSATEEGYEPKFLATKLLLCYAVLLFSLKMVLVPFYLIMQEADFFADVTKSVLIATTNRERGNVALSHLEESPILNEAAYLKAKDMFEKGYFDHNSPEGATPWYWFKEAGYSYERAGENLAIGFIESEEVVQAWLDSPSHKQNLLNPAYKEIGIAVLAGDFQGRETTVVVQLFGTSLNKVAQQAAASNAPIDSQVDASDEQRSNELSVLGSVAVAETPEVQAETEFTALPEENVLPEPVSGVVLSNLAYFMAQKYYTVIQTITYLFLIFIILVLLLNIFLRVGTQWHLILKMAFFAVLLTSFVLIDKAAIINLIPHQFGIL